MAKRSAYELYHVATAEELETKIKRLSHELYKLDQNYDWPAGPVYISLHSQYKPAGNMDGSIALTLMGGFLSDAFTMAANDNIEGGASTLDPHGGFEMIANWMEGALEAYEQHKEAAKHGQGTMAMLGDGGFCGAFCGAAVAANDTGTSEIMKHHMRIEGAISSLYRQLSAVQGMPAANGPISADDFARLAG